MNLWTALLDVLILLTAALALGTLCERLKQSAIVGYLLAGILLGPNALDWMSNHKAVSSIAELGVALLLFTIGLEFSWRRLRSIGLIALGGGTLQVVLTLAATAGICMALGLRGGPAFATGAMVALSSTACVLRLLVNRAEIDSVYGRHALGILLFQDIAVVPLVLIVTVLGQAGTATEIGWQTARGIVAGAVLALALHFLLKYVLPALIGMAHSVRNREVPILLAMVTAVGAAWAAHWLGVSPVLGSFIAGVLLAESPFATQVRSDVAPLRTLFVTLFFSSIGMLADPAWALAHWALVVPVTIAILLGKTVITCGVMCLFRSTLRHAVATAVCLAQVGEFSFVLIEVARGGGLIEGPLFKLMISATVVTLFLTPYLVGGAQPLARLVLRVSTMGRQGPQRADEPSSETGQALRGHVLIVGFGPAAQRVAEVLPRCCTCPLVVVELNAKTASQARSGGLRVCVGDATRREVLEHLDVEAAAAVLVTVPDPATVRQVVKAVRSLAPETLIIARARYHVYRLDLTLAGAQVVVDEEDEVGLRMASIVCRDLGLSECANLPDLDSDAP